MILETGLVAATANDILAAGRLNSIPYGGTLTIDVIAGIGAVANHYDITVQLPNGDVPVDAQQVPASNPALAGVMDERQLQRFSFRASQGGHFTVNLVLTGAGTAMWRAVLSP